MKKSDKILVLFYIFLAISLVVTFASVDYTFSHLEFAEVVPQPLTEFTIEKTVHVSKEKLFNTMISVEDYPKILPKNILSVKIIEQKPNEILAEEEIMELGIKTKVPVKHTFYPYDQQIIEIIEGDAAGTKVILEFEDVDGLTKLTANAEIKLQGIFIPFGFIPKPNLSHALDTVITSFVEYAKGFDSPFEKTVDDLFREILLRQAVAKELNYYSKLLESGELNENQLRIILLHSGERKSMFLLDIKNIDELQDETKIIIESIYEDLLHRAPDRDGMMHYGSLLESNKITEIEIRNEIFNSEEALNVRLEQPAAYIVDFIFVDMFGRHATQEELDTYSPLIHEKKMTRFELRDILENYDKVE